MRIHIVYYLIIALNLYRCATVGTIQVKTDLEKFTQLVRLEMSHDEENSPRLLVATYIIEKKKNDFVTGSLIVNVNLDEGDAPLEQSVELNINGYEFILKLRALTASNPHRQMVDVTREYQPAYIPLNEKIFSLMQRLKTFKITLQTGKEKLVYIATEGQVLRLIALTKHDPRKSVKESFEAVHDL